MGDEPTPDAQAPTGAPASDEAATNEPAQIEPATDDATADEPAPIEPVAAPAAAPRRSIARDVALVAVVFVAVFILLAGLLWLAVPSGERGATRAAPISTLRSMADPTPVVTAL